MVITGHGWGHGIGMGQWGALGYAIGADNGDGNGTWQQIVTHYYGGTTDRTDGNDAQTVSVAMTENNGNDVIATARGGVSVPGGPGRPRSVRAGGQRGLERLRRSGVWRDQRHGAPGGRPGSPCRPPRRSTAGPIQLCMAHSLTLHGTLLGTYNSSGAARTVNLVPMVQYLSDVVPSESPAGWGTLGGRAPRVRPGASRSSRPRRWPPARTC